MMPPPRGTIAWKLERGERVNLLLLAYGGAGGDDPDFTDAIVVVSLRPVAGTAAAISLPRYLASDVPVTAGMPVTAPLYAAYALGVHRDNPALRDRWRTATGAGDLAAASVSLVIGQPIDGWLATDSEAFAALIDAIGGITLDAPEPLDDPRYPLDDSARTTHIHFEAGDQRLDGSRAVEYSRSRMSTSESDRARRQALVLAGLMQAIRAPRLGPPTLGALPALEGGLRTNLTLADLRTLADQIGRVDLPRMRRLDLGATDLLEEQTMPGGAELLVPRSGDYEEVRRYVAAALP